MIPFSICVQDKINAFWEISKKELEDTKAQLRNKDREMEELEERHQVEIKVLPPCLCLSSPIADMCKPTVFSRYERNIQMWHSNGE